MLKYLSMPTIRLLSQSMINKIAAGEVIERPASVVKELVENSIDAEATRIDIAVENGGSNLIRIVDNGHGIESDQLELALSPHATSKLTNVDDLFRIFSFGFRGEALASVAEISQLTVKSRTNNNHEGAMIQTGGGDRSDITPCGMPVGTQMEVRNLFFNTPVRRRYLKSVTTEFGHVSETLIRLALPQPNIHFTLKHNGRMVYELLPTEDPLARIRQVFGDDTVRDMIAVESPQSAIVRVSGYVSHPSQHRANNRMQYFFLNRRFIKDRALQHALNEAYRGLLVSGRFPLAFLHVELPPEMFDVNVHPTKMEVRFLDSNRVYTGFLGVIREKFLQSDLRNKGYASSMPQEYVAKGHAAKEQTSKGESAKGESVRIPPWEMDETAEKSYDNPQHAMNPDVTEKKRQMVQNWIAELESAGGKNATTQPSGLEHKKPYHLDSESFGEDFSQDDYSREDDSQLSLHHLPSRDKPEQGIRPPNADAVPPFCGGGKIYAPTTVHPSGQSETIPAESASSTQPVWRVSKYLQENRTPDANRLAVQMLDRYLVMELPDGIAIIDQHALHERILFEQLNERMRSGQLDAQRLLVPIPIDLSPNEFSCVQENRMFFRTLGLHVEPFGGCTILISALPAILSKVAPEEIVSAMIEPFLELGKKLSGEELLKELLHGIACKAAVKAGDHLSDESLQHLLQMADEEILSHHCPHGRPSTIVFSREEIDKMFAKT